MLRFIFLLHFLLVIVLVQGQWNSTYVRQEKNGTLVYTPDEKGNTIPDFSKVGYHHAQKEIPFVPVVKIIEAIPGNCEQLIQSAIDEVAAMPLNAAGFRGAILLRKGIYNIPGTIRINESGIVLRGEGEETILMATGTGQRSLISVSGTGNIKEQKETRVVITDKYVPVGAKSFMVSNAAGYQPGDHIIVFRPGTAKWISDLKMDQIEARDSATKQWQPAEYDLQFERQVTRVEGNRFFIDNPVVMAMEDEYGGGAVYKYTFDGRVNEVGVENLVCRSEYSGDTDENHGWNAVMFNRVENGWVRKVTAIHFGYSCVNLGAFAKNITVDSCRYLQPKSQVTGGRRYSFNNDGQQNLVQHCFASEGRHDYVTGARVCGPNVFYNCQSELAKSDIGPHHRWAMGTLFDNIVTDGEINIQDRGNWGTGHGWSGVNQVLWNCTAAAATVQNPWVSGKNYVIGLQGNKKTGRLNGRPDGNWEGQNTAKLSPVSLYQAQLKSE